MGKPLSVLDFCVTEKCKGELLLKKDAENNKFFLECSKSPKCNTTLKVTKADVKRFIDARIDGIEFCYGVSGTHKNGSLPIPDAIKFIKKEDKWKHIQ